MGPKVLAGGSVEVPGQSCGEDGAEGSPGTSSQSFRELGHLGPEAVVGHSHRKRTYQMVSFFSWGPNRGFS